MNTGQFHHPIKVMVFDEKQKFIAIISSLHSAAQLTFGNKQSISSCCTGRYVSTNGFYFRHLNPELSITKDDMEKLKLHEYDQMCGNDRRYHSEKKLQAERKSRRFKVMSNRKNQ